ncbi:hypothetical protein [Marinomonas gallaica]|uniref:hypothetical protein n=1 Tax=Marinomonas gallaica TaxID=1806667 RepID=UPI003A92582F
MFRKLNQQGNVLIVVLFVIIVMGYLAASLMRISWSNQSGLTREFLGTKAWFVAQSANEWALTKIYPLGGTSNSVSTICSIVVSGATPNITKTAGCEIKPMRCAFIGEFNSGESDAVALFKIQSKATCGSALSQVQRQQEVWVRD